MEGPSGWLPLRIQVTAEAPREQFPSHHRAGLLLDQYQEESPGSLEQCAPGAALGDDFRSTSPRSGTPQFFFLPAA